MDLAKQYGTLFVTLCVRTSANQMIFQLFCKNRRAFWFRHLLYCRLFIDARTRGAAKVTKVSFVSALFFIVLYRGNLIFSQYIKVTFKTSYKQTGTTTPVYDSVPRLFEAVIAEDTKLLPSRVFFFAHWLSWEEGESWVEWLNFRVSKANKQQPCFSYNNFHIADDGSKVTCIYNNDNLVNILQKHNGPEVQLLVFKL